MDNGVYTKNEISNDEIKEKISNKESFIINDIEQLYFTETIETIENIIESKGLTCRVYTKGRSGAFAGIAIPTPFTVIGGTLAAVGVAAHNIATYNPDYEIAKNRVTQTLTISYVK